MKRKSFFILVIVVTSPFVTSTRAGEFTNPAPSMTVTPSEMVLHMELNGFNGYGVADAAADIAYAGDSNTWTFAIPGSIDIANYPSAFFRASLVADDHYDGNLSLYGFDVMTNGNLVYSGPADLPHGSPFGSLYSNWVQQDFAVASPLTSSMTFALHNSSQDGGWIAIDWIELHLIPEPDGLALCIAGCFCSLGVSSARRHRGLRFHNSAEKYVGL
jgi:hypothetical protein